MPHIAGAGRGDFNTRFSQAVGLDQFARAELPVHRCAADGSGDRTHRRAARQVRRADLRAEDHLHEFIGRILGHGPRRGAVHTSIDGKSDLTLPANVRVVSLRRHRSMVPRSFRRARRRSEARTAAAPDSSCRNPTPHTIGLRAFVLALDRWVRDGVEPPASKYPRLADGTLTTGRRAEVAGADTASPSPKRRFPNRVAPAVDRPRRGDAGRSSCRRSMKTATSSPASGCPIRPCRSARSPAGTSASTVDRQPERDRAAARQPDSVCEDRGRSRRRSAQVARGTLSRQVRLSRPRHRSRARAREAGLRAARRSAVPARTRRRRMGLGHRRGRHVNNAHRQ